MKIGLTTSVIGHALVIAWGVISLPSVDPFRPTPVESLPVDIVSVEEFSRLTKGAKSGDETVPPLAAKKTPEPKPTEIRTPGLSDIEKPAEVAAPPGREIAARAPADEPAPPQPEPATRDAPPPVSAPVVRPAEPAPPVAEPEPEITKPDPALAAAPKPRKRPSPPRKVQIASARTTPDRKARSRRTGRKAPPSRDRRRFDANQINALLNKVDPASGGARQSRQDPALGRATGRDRVMTQSELDALRAQIIPCFNPPIGAAGAEDIVVSVLMELERDGSISGRPRVVNSGSNPYFRATADAALRAVLRCAPYRLPEEKYAAWNEVKVNFGLRDIVVGY